QRRKPVAFAPPSGQSGTYGEIKAYIAELMRLDEASLEEDVPLKDQGFDSIMGSQLLNEVELRYRVKLPLEQLSSMNLIDLREAIRAETG
ncbi:MAG: acyl carrier protein, partial [Verrucomicrobiota bacterium]